MRRKFRVVVDGETFIVEIEEIGAASPEKGPSTERPVTAAPQLVVHGEQVGGDGIVSAPLPGVVSEVRVKIGERVGAGDVLLVLEAMKMENEIYAPIDGVVEEINVDVGQQVNRGDRLIHVS